MSSRQKRTYREGKKPTTGQWGLIYFIQHNTGAIFKGATARDADDFIRSNLQKARNARDAALYSQILTK